MRLFLYDTKFESTNIAEIDPTEIKIKGCNAKVILTDDAIQRLCADVVEFSRKNKMLHYDERSILNPLAPDGAFEPITHVLRELASEGGSDGVPSDQLQIAADYIDDLLAQLGIKRGV